MRKAEAIALLRAHEAELRAAGIASLSLFGSTARDEQTPLSDVDVAVTLRRDIRIGLSEYVGLHDRLIEVLGMATDMVSEPARRPRVQAAIDRDRLHVF